MYWLKHQLLTPNELIALRWTIHYSFFISSCSCPSSQMPFKWTSVTMRPSLEPSVMILQRQLRATHGILKKTKIPTHFFWHRPSGGRVLSPTIRLHSRNNSFSDPVPPTLSRIDVFVTIEVLDDGRLFWCIVCHSTISFCWPLVNAVDYDKYVSYHRWNPYYTVLIYLHYLLELI